MKKNCFHHVNKEQPFLLVHHVPVKIKRTEKGKIIRQTCKKKWHYYEVLYILIFINSFKLYFYNKNLNLLRQAFVKTLITRSLEMKSKI